MKALVLSGGGAKGAYQVGAVRYLLGERGEHYDILCGTSVGALNAGYLAMFPGGEELDAATGLHKLWLDEVDDGKIWRKWYFGILGELPVVLPKWLGGKQSAYTTKPLAKLVEKYLKPQAVATSGKKLRVGAVSLSTGERRVWDEGSGEALKGAIMASSSFPIFFEPIHIDGEVYTDDGVRETTPIEEAIKAGATHIDVISTGPDQIIGHFDPKANGLALAQRILDSMSLEIEKWDLKVVDLYNALYEWKHPGATGKGPIALRVLRPKQNLLESALDFSKEKVLVNMDRGYRDAKESGWA